MPKDTNIHEVTMADNTAKNDITNDRIVTKRSTYYTDKYDSIDWSVKLEQPANYLLKDDKDGFNAEDESKPIP